MPTVTWANMASSNPMGQQAYEREIRRNLRELADEQWCFRQVVVASFRSRAGGVRRIPARAFEHVRPLPARLLGAACYRTLGLVHRFDLRIPPALGHEVVTIHDLPPLRYPDEGRLPRSAAASARRARRVICPSAFARREVVDLLGVDPARVRVIHNGVGPEFGTIQPMDDAALRRLGISGRFVLHAAGATQRKNLVALSAAWRGIASLAATTSLVLLGAADDRRNRLFREVPGVVMPGPLPPADVAALMGRAAAVVVPSTYEGFGLPALEAMACGRPVVAADTGALPEICGDGALLVPPTAVGIAEGLEKVLTDDALAARLAAAGRARAAQFSWRRAAEQHLAVYREVIAGAAT